MKKLFIMFLLVSILICGLVCPKAEAGDIEIGFKDVTWCLLYDLENQETLSGLKTSFLQKDRLNLDIGIITDEEIDNIDQVDLFVGVSYDADLVNLKDVPVLSDFLGYITLGKGESILQNTYLDAGAFVSPAIIDDGEFRYGVYGGLTYKF